MKRLISKEVQMRIIILAASALTAIMGIRMAIQSGPTNNNTILLACIAIAAGLYGWFYEKLKKLHWLTITIAAVFVSVIGFSVFLAAYGRRITADYTEDVVLVLGGGIRQGEIRPTLQMRLDQALAYHRNNPNAIIIVTGGTSYRETNSEADAMARYLIEHGVPASQVLLEEVAYSTFSNMLYSRDILDAHFHHPPRAVIVTSNFHMFRSARFADMLGIDVTIYPAPTPWLRKPFYYVREVAAVVKMWIIGR